MKYIIALALISLVFSIEEIPKENDVYVLKEKTFDDFIKSHDHVLVKFYAPWCGHCKRLAPEFSKAAVTLEKENIFLAQVDATAENALGSRFKVRGYPTLKYFKKGEEIDYNGGRTEKEIINWLRKRATGEIVKKLANQKELEDFKSKNEILLVYFGSNEQDLKIIEKVANDYDDHTFAKIDDKNSMEENKVQPGTVKLFKNFENKFDIMKTKLTEENLIAFAYGYSFPALMRLSPKNIPRSFHKKRGALVLFRHDDAENVKELDAKLEKAAEEIRSIIPVLYADTKVDFEKELVNYIDVKVENLPVIKIADTRDGIKKFTFTGKMEVNEIIQFAKDWRDGKLKDDDTLKAEGKKEEKKEEINDENVEDL